MSSELNCTSRGFSFSFLDCRGLYGEIFDKSTQPEYAGLDMIHMPHIQSNISITANLGTINGVFYRFLRLSSSNIFFVSQVVSLILFLENKGYPLNIHLKWTTCVSLSSKWVFVESCKWVAFKSPLGIPLSSLFCLLCSVFSSSCDSSFVFHCFPLYFPFCHAV
jgi:hypothetical protein